LAPSAHAPPPSSYNKSGAVAILPPPSPAHLRAPQAKQQRAEHEGAGASRYPASGAPTSRVRGSASRLRRRHCIPQVSWHPGSLFLLALPRRFLNSELALCLVSVVLDPCEIGVKIRFPWSHWPAGRVLKVAAWPKIWAATRSRWANLG
jgi:hypothetical protein